MKKTQIISLMLALILLMSCFVFAIPVSAADDSYINGTWVFGSVYQVPTGLEEGTYNFGVLFESAGYSFREMQLFIDANGYVTQINYIRAGGTAVEAYKGGWGNMDFKTLTFTNAILVEGSDFATAFKALAARDTSNEITFALNGMIYTCVNGMTFDDYCNSSYNIKNWYIDDVVDVNGNIYTNRVVTSSTELKAFIVGKNGNDVIRASTLIQANASYSTVSITTAKEETDNGDVNLPVFPEIDASKYTSLLDDLKKDSTFDVNKYPGNASMFTLDLFQVAESENGELFLYVYNPSAGNIFLEAKYINMSLDHYESKNPTYKLYSLSLLDRQGTLAKYLVNDFVVDDNSVRYYNVVGIYTPFNDGVHESTAADDDVTNHVGLPVGKCFEAITESGNVHYACRKIDYVDVDINNHGIVRFPDAFGPFEKDNTDAHYIAITINNFNVTDIFDIDVRFITQSYWYYYNTLYPSKVTHNYGEEVINVVTIDKQRKSQNVGGGFLGTSFLSYHYEWDSIMTAQQFKNFLEEASNEEMIGFDADALDASEFVISFYETPYTYSVIPSGTHTITKKTSTIVSEVTLLRMHFATPEGVYNLGVVSDIVTDDGEPDVEVTPGDNIQNKAEDVADKLSAFLEDFINFQTEAFEGIFGLIVIVIVVFFVIYILPYIKKGIDYIFGGVVSLYETVITVLLMPFAFLGELFGVSSTKNKKSKKKRGKRR